NQHGIGRKRLFDGEEVGRRERSRQIDVADFSGETGRDRANSDGHGSPRESVRAYPTLAAARRGVAAPAVGGGLRPGSPARKISASPAPELWQVPLPQKSRFRATVSARCDGWCVSFKH